MTKTLDKLVGPNYDSRIRPSYGGKPVEVELNMAVTGMVIIINVDKWYFKSGIKLQYLPSKNIRQYCF